MVHLQEVRNIYLQKSKRGANSFTDHIKHRKIS